MHNYKTTFKISKYWNSLNLIPWLHFSQKRKNCNNSVSSKALLSFRYKIERSIEDFLTFQKNVFSIKFSTCTLHLSVVNFKANKVQSFWCCNTSHLLYWHGWKKERTTPIFIVQHCSNLDVVRRVLKVDTIWTSFYSLIFN